jgi:hypothetical protein
MDILTKELLDNMVCSNPDCNHTAHDSEMYLHSKCHPESPAWCIYYGGVITVICAECENIIADILVASGQEFMDDN